MPGPRPPRGIALVVHPDRPVAHALASHVVEWWSKRGIPVVVHRSDEGPNAELFGDSSRDIDLAICLGGDGTVLRTVAAAAPSGIPVLGVNLGHLGYLTMIEPNEIEHAFEILAAGSYDVEERMLLDVVLERGGVRSSAECTVAMNEVVIEKTSDGHTIHLAVEIGADQFLTYAADGMIVATPTGSTAYNLSLRGPIVSPRMRALVMTPIAPHMLFDRTLIIEPELEVGFELLEDREAMAIVDGERLGLLAPGDRIVVRASSHVARMAKIGDRGFYKILHTKFGLTDR